MVQFLFLALILGVKHSFDADHVVAVSNFLTRAKNLRHATRLGLSWALGHMLLAGTLTILLFQLKGTALQSVLGKFEWLVAIMLVGIGIWSIVRTTVGHAHLHRHDGSLHTHWHQHEETEHAHEHKKLFGIGVIHGLASNDELLILLTASLGLATLPSILTGVAIFSIGVVIGMTLFSIIFAAAVNTTRRQRTRQVIDLALGSVSILYGMYMITSLINA